MVRMELTRRAGNEPPLVGLLRVYKDYYPDVIIGDAVSGRASVFTVFIFDLLVCRFTDKLQAPES